MDIDEEDQHNCEHHDLKDYLNAIDYDMTTETDVGYSLMNKHSLVEL